PPTLPHPTRRPAELQHSSSNPGKLVDIADKTTVEKDRGPVGCNLELDFRCYVGKLNARVSLHFHCEGESLIWLYDHIADEVRISRLTHCNGMFSRQQEDLLVVPELTQVADVLPVNPDARGLLYFTGADKADFSQDSVLREAGAAEKKKDPERRQTQCLEFVRHSHRLSQLSDSRRYKFKTLGL